MDKTTTTHHLSEPPLAVTPNKTAELLGVSRAIANSRTQPCPRPLHAMFCATTSKLSSLPRSVSEQRC